MPACLSSGCFDRGVDAGQGQDVAAQPLEEAIAPVHRQERLAGAQAVVLLHRQDQAAAPALHLYQLAVQQTPATHVLGVHAEQRLFDMAEQPRRGAGAAHAVPLVAQPTGVERQRIACLALFLRRLVVLGNEARAAIGSGEHTVAIQPRGAQFAAWRKRPLLRTEGVDQCVAQAAVVQIAGGGERLVLLEQRFGTLEREQARRAGTQVTFQPSGKIASDRPVRAGFAGAGTARRTWLMRRSSWSPCLLSRPSSRPAAEGRRGGRSRW